MTRRLTPAQYRAEIERLQRKQKQAVDNYNRDLRKRNAAVKQAVNHYDRAVRDYNAKARAHNARVENQRLRLNQEIRRLNSRPAVKTFVTYRTSVDTVARSYTRVEEKVRGRILSDAERDLVDRASEEAANSVYLLNAMDGDGDNAIEPTEDDLRSPSMQAELSPFSPDLLNRWQGALFSLSPSNPDAARHFCTSAREVLTTMLDTAAPDPGVEAADPNCERTDRGTPTRRAKVRFLLARKGVTEQSLEDVVEDDMDNVVTLFRTFNDGTHGHAGRFTITQLSALRIRVESAIGFIHALCVTD